MIVDRIVIDMATHGGAPTYRASGFLYGLSPDASQPPPPMTDEIKVRQLRAGGSQLPAPDGGWVTGGYAARWELVKAYRARAGRTGAHLEVLLSDLWGADGADIPRYPGDDGDWSGYTAFLDRIVGDAKADGMTGQDIRWDVWNEADYDAFWRGRGQDQYLEMFRRGTLAIRAALPGAVIVGPSSACSPGDPWFAAYLDYVKANDVVPDVLSWHTLPGDPAAEAAEARALLAARDMSVSGFSVNEYGAAGDDQQPGPSAWYVARLERGGCDGSRANWGMVGRTPSLHDTLGELTTAGTGLPMGQWWVYKRYAEQSGVRAGLTPGAAEARDGVVFQDPAARRSIAVLGATPAAEPGHVAVRYDDVPPYLLRGGSTNIRVERLPATGSHVGAPVTVSDSRAEVGGGSVTVTIDWADPLDAYAVTLTP
ncbi:hypothetical protein ACIBG4_29260 [Nonomuraea sp. NPDC050383]|uniref:GH39 family glycosyl hydrolase n=1 Tax=Nonomuraea sp. NPDC050383 TaxID=3364362 RepID=UPI0037A6B86C